MMRDEDYQKTRCEAKKYFEELQPVVSPCISEEVTFSVDGFSHIVYKKGNVERNRNQQVRRFKILPLAIKLISIATTYQEYEEIEKEVSIRRYGNRMKKMRLVKYWGIAAIIDNQKIKVILRKIGNGYLRFWSVIPAYATSALRDGKYIQGDLEED